MKHILSLISLSLLLFGCDRYTYVHVHSYVYSYVDVDNLRLDTLDKGDHLKIAVIPENIICNYDVTKNEDMFEYYCKLHNDTSFPKTKISTTQFITSRYLIYDYSSVNVTADVDWDFNHPSGRSLNDIVHFVAMSPYKYILSGYEALCPNPLSDGTASEYYKDVYMSESFNSQMPDYPIDKRCSDLMTDDLILLDFCTNGPRYKYALAFLVFETPPPKPCTVNVKLTATTGKEFGASIDVE